MRACWLYAAVAGVALQFHLASAQGYATRGATESSGPQGWRVRAALSVGEHYSDNISLSTKGSERSEWTTRISPSVSVSHNTARLQLEGTYSPELLYRVNQATTDLSHYLNAKGTTELWDRTLFLDVLAGISQQNVSLLGAQSDSNINTTANRTSIGSYSISPYLRHDFGFDAVGELRYTHDNVHQSGNSSSTSSSTSDRIDARLSSGPAFKLLTWKVAVNLSKVDYSRTGQEIDSKSYSASAGRLVTSDLRLNGTVGYEDSGYPTSTGGDLKGMFWSVGPEWTPTERTRVAVSYGRRYFGPSRSMIVSHRWSRSFFSLDFNESVTTTRASFSSPVALASPEAVFLCQLLFPNDLSSRQRCLSQFSVTLPLNFLTDSLFLEKRLQGQFGIQGVRNTVNVSLFSSNRKAITNTTTVGFAGDFNSSQNIKQTGSSVSWSTRLSPTLAASAALSMTRNAFEGLDRTDRLTTLRVGVTKDFDPKISGSLTLARAKNDSSAASTSYDENSIAATLGMRF